MVSDLTVIYSQNIDVQSEPPIYRLSINKSIQNLSASAQLSSLRAVYCGRWNFGNFRLPNDFKYSLLRNQPNFQIMVKFSDLQANVLSDSNRKFVVHLDKHVEV